MWQNKLPKGNQQNNTQLFKEYDTTIDYFGSKCEIFCVWPKTRGLSWGINEAPRVYGFDLNSSWQADKDHYDNQKTNGLTFPRTIRQSAFTQRLDIEGCHPLSLPVAALMYQQGNNHWLRKLAHGRELYLTDPSGGHCCGGVYDRVADATQKSRRRPGQGLQLQGSTGWESIGQNDQYQYAAQQIAEVIQGWLPARATDAESQHEITRLRNQLAQLRQQLGGENLEFPNPPRSNQTGSSPAAAPIARALLQSFNNPSPPAFDPCCLLTVPTTTNQWLLDHMPSTLAVRAFTKWLKDLPISDAKRTVLTTNIDKMEKWWARQPAAALETVERVAVMMCIPVNLLGKNYEALNLLRAMTAAISMTN